MRYQADSRANPYASETLSLYLPRGERLLKLLDGLELYRERGEWDTQCAGRFETVRGSLSLAPGTSQGYADLLLNRIHTEQVSRMEGDECVTQEQSARLSSTTLRYRRRQLPPAEEFGAGIAGRLRRQSHASTGRQRRRTAAAHVDRQ